MIAYLAEFELFWKAYPLRVGKATAFAAWNKHVVGKDVTLAEILETLSRWRKSKKWLQDGGDFIPHPTTWINRHGWNDELPLVYKADDSRFNTADVHRYDEEKARDIYVVPALAIFALKGEEKIRGLEDLHRKYPKDGWDKHLAHELARQLRLEKQNVKD